MANFCKKTFFEYFLIKILELLAGGLTVEEVVERVLKDLSPTVVTVVRATVQGSDRFDLSSVEAR